MKEVNIRRDLFFKTLEKLLRDVGTKVGLNYGPQSAADQVGFGSPIGNRIPDPLLMLLFWMLHYFMVLHHLYLKTTASLYCRLHLLHASHVCRNIEPVSRLFVYQTLSLFFFKEKKNWRKKKKEVNQYQDANVIRSSLYIAK